MTTRTKGPHYLIYSRSLDILKWGGGELTNIVTPMPSFLTLIFPSPESFQRQRKTQRERALAPEGQTQKGLPCALKSSGPAYALGFSVCGIWWIFQCWEAKHPHLLYLATVLLTFLPSSSPHALQAPLLPTHSCSVHAAASLAPPPADTAASIWDSLPVAEKESAPGFSSFIYAHGAGKEKEGGGGWTEREDLEKKLWWARDWWKKYLYNFNCFATTLSLAGGPLGERFVCYWGREFVTLIMSQSIWLCSSWNFQQEKKKCGFHYSVTEGLVQGLGSLKWKHGWVSHAILSPRLTSFLHPWPCTLFWDRLKIVCKIWGSLSHLTDFILHECRLKAPCQFFLLGFWGRHSTAFTLGWVLGDTILWQQQRARRPHFTSNSLDCVVITRKDEEVQSRCWGFWKFAHIPARLNLN